MKNLNKFICGILFILCLFGIASAQETEKQKSTSVKITKPSYASYSKEARENDITGTIILKVEFLPTGKIGKVEEVVGANDDKMRKYGLVDQAIKAAKRIKFEPATADGKPVKQIRSITYSFTIDNR